MKKKYRKYWLISLITFIVLTTVFLSIPVFVAPDSVLYYWYKNIFSGNIPFSRWNITRGPVMGLLVFLSQKIFGDNGFSILLYLSYLIVMIIILKLLLEILSKYKNKKVKIWGIIIYIILIVFNPMLIGYFRIMLTEFFATVLATISCYISYKYIDHNVKIDKTKNWLFILIFSILTIIAWFLKQPYVITVSFPFIISVILSIIKYPNKINILTKTCSFLLSITFLFLSIKSWDLILVKNNVIFYEQNSSGSYISDGLIKGLTNLRRLPNSDNYNLELILDLNLSEEDKGEITKILAGSSEFDDYIVYNVLNIRNNEIIDTIVYYKQNDDNTFNEAFTFYIKNFLKRPINSLESYVSNYLSIINIMPTASIHPASDYYPLKYYSNYDFENYSIGLAYTYSNSTILWKQVFNEESYDKEYLKLYDNNNSTPKIIQDITIKIQPFYSNLFRLVFFIAPFLTVFYLISFVKISKKNKSNQIYQLLTLLFGYATLQVLFHSIFGALIDRYVIPAYPIVILGFIIAITTIRIKPNQLIRDKKSLGKEKVLFVIPAYNEELNIEKTLLEIKKEIDYADILVINDCSSDKTEEIVRKNKVNIVNNIYNMRYAHALQTGIKYAYNNNYSYVISFDADGQHIASEATKLLKALQKTKSDIIIGSRFLEKTNYNHTFFRKIGTKLFEIIIIFFCNKKISDPTSGFQCINRAVIKRYATIGKYPEFPDANLIMEMLIEGYKIGEIPVQMREREFGTSMHGGIIKPIKYMVKVIYAIFFVVIKNIDFKRGEEIE